MSENKNTCRNAFDFRKNLEARLQREAKETGIDLHRVKRRVAFDRLLARIFVHPNPPFFLKGGYAMELRLASARATKDIDLTYLQRLKGKEISFTDLLLRDLQSLSSMDLGDFFVYRIGSAQLDIENAPYGGARFPVSSFINGKPFVQFHLDAGGDTLAIETEEITTPDWLNFCGITPPSVRMISPEQQFAEKIHAYTLPRDRQNTRVKDLIDLFLLIQMRALDHKRLLEVLCHVFKVRNTHPLPEALPPPPSAWAVPYAALAEECRVYTEIETVFIKIASIYLEILKTQTSFA